MTISEGAIIALRRFLCERQNALVKKKANRKDISFEIKRDRFGALLKQINEDICRDDPVDSDWLENTLNIFVKERLVEPIEDNKDRFMVTEKAYKLSGIEMVKEELKKASAEIKEKPAKKAAEKKEKIEEEPPQPIRWVKSEEERIARSKAIAQFEKGILLYYDRRYQEAIIEFQKVMDNFNMVIDVVYKAKQYMKFCEDDLRKNKIKEKGA